MRSQSHAAHPKSLINSLMKVFGPVLYGGSISSLTAEKKP